MSAIGDAKDGLVARLQTIAGLRVFRDPPDSVNEFPAVVILTSGVAYEGDLGAAPVYFGDSTLRHQLRVLLLLDFPGSGAEAWAELELYLSPTGSKSIPAAIEGDLTMGGKVDDLEVTEARGLGPMEFQGATYQGAEFLVTYTVAVS